MLPWALPFLGAGAEASSWLAPILGGAAAGGMDALFGGGSDDGGYKDPDFLDFDQLIPFLMSWLNSEEGKRKVEEYEARADQQYADAIGVATESGGETLATYDASSGAALQELLNLRDRQTGGASDFYDKVSGDRLDFLSGFEGRGADLMSGYDQGLSSFLSQLGGRHDDILGGYEDRYLKAEGELEGYGEQMGEDIDRYFEEQQMRTAMDLQRRGLLSSDLAAGYAGEVTERQTAEQRRLEEALMMNRINVLGGMSGEKLAAQERLGTQTAGYEYGGLNTAMNTQAGLDAMYAAYDAAMRGDEQAAMQYMHQVDAISSGNIANFYGTEAINRSNIVNRGFGDVLDTIMGFNYMPPQQNNLNWDLGYNTGGTAQAANPWASFAAQAGQGMGQGLSNWLSRPTTPDTSYESWEPGQYQMNQWHSLGPTTTYEVPPYLMSNDTYYESLPPWV